MLAMDGGIATGCVALRDLGHGTREMKRLYVTPEHRGLGLGRLLVEEVLRRAERMGYRRTVLDSLPEGNKASKDELADLAEPTDPKALLDAIRDSDLPPEH